MGKSTGKYGQQEQFAEQISCLNQYLRYERSDGPHLSAESVLNKVQFPCSVSNSARAMLSTVPLDGVVIIFSPTPHPPLQMPYDLPDPFEHFGRAVASYRPRVRHVPYASSVGVTRAQLEFIALADAILIISAPPSVYLSGFARHSILAELRSGDLMVETNSARHIHFANRLSDQEFSGKTVPVVNITIGCSTEAAESYLPPQESGVLVQEPLGRKIDFPALAQLLFKPQGALTAGPQDGGACSEEPIRLATQLRISLRFAEYSG